MFIVQIISQVISILIYAIFARVISSYLGPKWSPANNKFVGIIYDITDPIIKPFQRFQIGNASMAIDLSPIFAIVALNVIQWLLYKIF
ncbi:MAG: hypothetical protein VR66_00480 [Peptococcaceae bacterium BRH_c23]|nr:MAG: hypothetical protein VR66_00480 [Peptococcaceae bacterium BRH_c23]